MLILSFSKQVGKLVKLNTYLQQKLNLYIKSMKFVYIQTQGIAGWHSKNTQQKLLKETENIGLWMSMG